MANPSSHLEYPKFQAFDPVTQEPLSGGKLFTYVVGTTTDKTAYTDYARTVTAANPIILDSNGECDIYLDGTYKLVLKKSDNTIVWTVDNYNEAAEIVPPSGTGAAPEAESSILNPSFEYDEDADNDPDNWTIVRVNDVDIVSDASTHGKYALKFTSPGGAPGVSGGGTATSDLFTAKGGIAYNLLFDIKSSDAGVHNIITINEYNAALGAVASTDVYDDATTNPTSFTTFLVEISLAATTRYVEIVVDGCNQDDATAGNTYVDNFRWYEQLQGSLLFNGTAGVDAVSGTDSASLYANDIEVSNGTVDGIFFVDTPNTAVTLANLTGSTYDVIIDNAGGTGDLILQTAGGSVTLATGGGVTLSGALAGTSGAFSSTLSAINTITLTSTDAGAATAPSLILYRNSASPAGNDVLAEILFDGEDSVGNQQTYARIYATIADPTSTSEDGQIILSTTVAGTTSARAIIAQGVQLGSPTGGDKGTGTLNVSDAIYVNNKQVLYDGMTLTEQFDIAGAFNISLSAGNFNLGTGDVLLNAVNFTTPAAVSGYSAGHVLYLSNDAPNATTAFDISTNIGAAFESVGRTGAGATNTWSALDSVPSTATSIIVKVRGNLDNSAATASALLYARINGSASAVGATTQVYAQAASPLGTGEVGIAMIYIPVTSTRIFDLAFSGSNVSSLDMYLVGWVDTVA